MTDGVTARITLAAVQARSQPGQVEADLEHAVPLVEHAASQGARLVVLPARTAAPVARSHPPGLA